jgi:DNA-directed RNA polymerase alpha subunit
MNTDLLESKKNELVEVIRGWFTANKDIIAIDEEVVVSIGTRKQDLPIEVRVDLNPQSQVTLSDVLQRSVNDLIDTIPKHKARITMTLNHSNITTIGQLVRLRRDELLRNRNFGTTSLLALTQALANFDPRLSLGMRLP